MATDTYMSPVVVPELGDRRLQVVSGRLDQPAQVNRSTSSTPNVPSSDRRASSSAGALFTIPAQAERDFEVLHRLPEDVGEGGAGIALAVVSGNHRSRPRLRQVRHARRDRQTVFVARFMAVIESDQGSKSNRPALPSAWLAALVFRSSNALGAGNRRSEIGIGVVGASRRAGQQLQRSAWTLVSVSRSIGNLKLGVDRRRYLKY